MGRIAAALGLCGLLLAGRAGADEAARKVVLIAGAKSHGPGEHEYERGMRLLKACLDGSPDGKGVRVEVHAGGWPEDPRTLDDADAIVLFSDGSDRDVRAHPLLREGRLEAVERLMRRGKGLVAIHYSVFVPSEGAGERFLDWIGGYFDYENGAGANHWYSKIRTERARVEVAAKGHPIGRGVAPFDVKEEFYYNIRFRPGDGRLTPILTAAIPGEAGPQVVAWAVERADGGRGFGYTGGHFHANWEVDGVRKLVLNAILWAAKADVPEAGVSSTVPRDDAGAAGPPPGGRFGGALDPRRGWAEAQARDAYRDPPLTVECWARLDGKAGFNVLVAHAPKESAAHWEIFSERGTGSFRAYLPGMSPSIVDSGTDVVDGRWHHLALVYEPRRARLYVDAREAADVALSPAAGAREAGPLWFGAYPPQGIGCEGLVDEVRISRGVRPIERVPDGPFSADERTVGLWHFDDPGEGHHEDASSQRNPAVEAGGLAYRVADPDLEVVRIDRVAGESLLSVRAGTTGRLFVGGREAIFAYEPDGRGGYGPRRLVYRFPPHSWVTDLEFRGDDLYAMTNAALYVFPGGRVRREGLAPRRLVWGMPVDLHVTCHGLAWGPEGDLYYATGDPLLNYGDFDRRPDHWGHWTLHAQPDGTRVPYTGQGGVFRCRPDGGRLRAVAGGTRGAFGLAFDRRWDLFTDDNDHESRPADYVPARLLHVAPHADFSWPRGWMAEKSPDRADLLTTVTPGLGREVPVGLACYDETYFPAPYRDALLLARWGERRLDRFPLVARGASYRAEGAPVLVGEGTSRPVGVAVGRGGRVFAVVCSMQANAWSPAYTADLVMLARADDPPGRPFDAYDAATAPADRLWVELSDPSRERRCRAHQEILRRGGDLLAEAARRLAAMRPDDPAAAHLPWLAAAGGGTEAARLLTTRAALADPAARVQAVRALDEFPALGAPRELFVRALDDPDPRVVCAAVVALFARPGPIPEALIRGPARGADTYLRQISTTLLAEQAGPDELAALCRSADAATRLAGVLAAGTRLTVPRATAPLPDDVPLNYRADNAQFQVRYDDATVDLRALGRVGSFTAAERWRSARRTEDQDRLFDLLLARLEDAEGSIRLQAAHSLNLLDDPRAGPRIARVREESVVARLARVPATPITEAWVVGPFADDAGASPRPESGPIDLSAEYPAAGGARSWRVGAGAGGFDLPPGAGGISTYYVYTRLQAGARERGRLEVAPGEGVQVWHDGRPSGDARGVLDLHPGSNDVLFRIRRSGGAAARVAISYQATGRVAAALPERLGPDSLATRLRAASLGADAARIPPAFLDRDWAAEAARGDRERGRRLFGADGLGCAKCHAIAPDQAGAGAPSLAGAGRRFTVPYLVESIVLPSKQVAPVFRATTIATTDGRILTGLVVGEAGESVELLMPDATRRVIPQAEVEDRRPRDVSAMPAGLVKTPDELRDLLAYLIGEAP